MKGILGILVVALIGVSGFLVYQNAELRKAHDDAQVAHAAVVEGARVASVESEQRAEEAMEAAAAVAQSAADADAAGDSGTEKKNPMEGIAEMMENPAMREVIKGQQQAVVDMMYGELYGEFDLSEGELKDFKKLVLDRHMFTVDSAMKMMTGKLSDEERKALGAATKEGVEEADTKIKEFLGDTDDVETYETYLETQPERQQVGQFKTQLETAGMELDTETEAQLVAAMYDERKNLPDGDALDFQNPKNYDFSDFTVDTIDEKIKGLGDYHKAVAVRATDILDDAQMEQFNTSLETSRKMAEMGMNMAKQFMGGGEGE